jgi:hypothetical protein
MSGVVSLSVKDIYDMLMTDKNRRKISQIKIPLTMHEEQSRQNSKEACARGST